VKRRYPHLEAWAIFRLRLPQFSSAAPYDPVRTTRCNRRHPLFQEKRTAPRPIAVKHRTNPKAARATRRQVWSNRVAKRGCIQGGWWEFGKMKQWIQPMDNDQGGPQATVTPLRPNVDPRLRTGWASTRGSARRGETRGRILAMIYAMEGGGGGQPGSKPSSHQECRLVTRGVKTDSARPQTRWIGWTKINQTNSSSHKSRRTCYPF